MDDYEKIKDEKRVAIIGHITKEEGSYQIIDKNEKVNALAAQGWNSLKED